jgi:hypothetical protein
MAKKTKKRSSTVGRAVRTVKKAVKKTTQAVKKMMPGKKRSKKRASRR